MKFSHLPMLSVTAIQNRRVICHWRCLTTLATNNTIVAGSLPPVQALFSIRRRFVTLKGLEAKTLTNNCVGLTNEIYLTAQTRVASGGIETCSSGATEGPAVA